MRAIEANHRLVLQGASPLFRPFFLGGLGLLILGAGLLILGHAGLAGIGVFLATFGSFVAMVPVLGRLPYRKQIIVDRAAGQFIRRDRTLLRLREETYRLAEVRGIEVEEARHVDGDPYFTLVLRRDAGDAVTLDRFTDRAAAWSVARLLRDHLAPATPAGPDPPDSARR